MPQLFGQMPEPEQLAADRKLAANLLAQVADADRSLEMLLRRYARPVVRGIVGSADVDEAMADLLTHVWERNWRVIRQWGQQAPLGRYLSTVARNFAIDFRNRRNPHSCPDEEIDAVDPVEPHWRADPERVHQAHEVRKCLGEATQRLTDVHKTVVQLRHGEGLGHQEIAERLGKTPGYVGPTLARAEEALRAKLREECRELLELLIGVREPVHG